MAGIPKVKITFDADFDDLKKGIKGGQGEIESFSDKVTDFGKKAGLAFAAAAGAAAIYAGKLAIDGVKAAIEDEAAQIRLANSLKNATGATNDQIKAIEANILKMSLASGVSDDKLRPALSRLALSTNDASKAQDLLTLALDVSQATGKDLEGVANALGKAYDGNNASLGKLGIGLSAAELKAMSFTEVQGKLSDLFGGASAANAKTFAGRMEILKVTFDEAKESVGAKLLPIIQDLVQFVIDKVIPALGKFADYFKPITKAIEENKETFKAFGQFIVDYVAPVLVTVLGGAFQVVGKIAGGVIDVVAAVIKGLNFLIQGAVQGINALIGVYNSVSFLPDVSKISAPSISVPTVSVPDMGGSASVPTISVPSVSGGGSTSGGSGVASAASGAASMDIGSFGTSGYAMAMNRNYGDTLLAAGQLQRDSSIVINVNAPSVIDEEGFSRAVSSAMNNGYYRGTGGATNLVGVK
ncbi:hypothetical protein UFOVP803_13 [uncultured Caudovirales phage]|uniref:Uncharacterized protein n=1 Tax=uncultured Caudovirales phage TaxID=2100421 RepID=A0A6J5P092_9CAUD|nr:hypothetical protein UFOVP803_13 [uncultured Caudovirales phage]